MTSYTNSATHTTEDTSSVQSVDVIRFALYPAFFETGSRGGYWYEQCVDSVTGWNDKTFNHEAKSILTKFPEWATTMVNSLHHRARSRGQAYQMAEGFTGQALAHDIIRGLLINAVSEHTVRTGTFLTDTSSASDVSARLMDVIMEAMLKKWAIFTLPTYRAVSVVSTGMQTQNDADSDDDLGITPNDSVSNVGPQRFAGFTPSHTEQPTSRVAEMRDAVTFDELVHMAASR